MATIEISEHKAPPSQYGNVLPVKRLPHKHTQVTSGPANVFAPQSSTAMVTIIPSADVRMSVSTDGTTPADPTGLTTFPLLQAGQRHEFVIDVANTKMVFV